MVGRKKDLENQKTKTYNKKRKGTVVSCLCGLFKRGGGGVKKRWRDLTKKTLGRRIGVGEKKSEKKKKVCRSQKRCTSQTPSGKNNTPAPTKKGPLGGFPQGGVVYPLLHCFSWGQKKRVGVGGKGRSPGMEKKKKFVGDFWGGPGADEKKKKERGWGGGGGGGGWGWALGLFFGEFATQVLKKKNKERGGVLGFWSLVVL